MSDDSSGHYHVSGGAIGFVGVLGLVIGSIDRWLIPQDLGFIDSTAIFTISGVFLAVAAWMLSRRPARSAG